MGNFTSLSEQEILDGIQFILDSLCYDSSYKAYNVVVPDGNWTVERPEGTILGVLDGEAIIWMNMIIFPPERAGRDVSWYTYEDLQPIRGPMADRILSLHKLGHFN